MRCQLCGQELRGSWSLPELLSIRPLRMDSLCRQCSATLSRIDQNNICTDCGRSGGPSPCRDCVRWRKMGEEVLHNRAIYEYNAAMKDLIERYKGIGDYNLRRCFEKDVASLSSLRAVFVPLGSEPKHLARRGFDPVLGIFGSLNLEQWLQKADTAQPQAKKDRLARMLTPQSFRCTCSPLRMARVKRVCLLDDLYTTGRTFHHAAAALRVAGYGGEIIARSLIR